MAEMHVFEDERGDTGPPWGVFERQCIVCGKKLVVVAKVDAEWTDLCREHDPAPDEAGKCGQCRLSALEAGMYPMTPENCPHKYGSWGGSACSDKLAKWRCHGCGRAFKVPPRGKR